jgi:hypothetical protein
MSNGPAAAWPKMHNCLTEASRGSGISGAFGESQQLSTYCRATILYITVVARGGADSAVNVFRHINLAGSNCPVLGDLAWEIGFNCSLRDVGQGVGVGPSSLKSAIRHVQPY